MRVERERERGDIVMLQGENAEINNFFLIFCNVVSWAVIDQGVNVSCLWQQVIKFANNRGTELVQQL